MHISISNILILIDHYFNTYIMHDFVCHFNKFQIKQPYMCKIVK